MSENWWVGKKCCCVCGALLEGETCLSCDHDACINCPDAQPSEVERLRIDIATLQQQLSASVPLEKYEKDMEQLTRRCLKAEAFHSSAQDGAEAFLAQISYADSKPHSAPAIARLMQDYAALRLAEAERTIETAVELLRTTRKWMTHKPCDNPKCVTCAAMRGVDAFIAARAALSAEAQKEGQQ